MNSVHNQALKKCDDLLKREQHIDVAIYTQNEASKIAYFTRLNALVAIARVLLKQWLPFQGHDKSKESYNKENFLEFYELLAEHDPALDKVVDKNTAGNCLMVSPSIQRGIAYCFAKDISHYILKEIEHDVFCLLADESRDVSCKEQMTVVLRCVDNCGIIKESFVGLVHVKETTSAYLKSSIDSLFAEYKLSLKQIRDQEYDGATNMRGEFNGLQSLIMRESITTYYVHCFAHQLQLVVMAIVRKHKDISNFFSMISLLLNVVGGITCFKISTKNKCTRL